MTKSFKINSLSSKQNQMFLNALLHSNYERVRLYLERFTITQKEFKTLCDEYLINANVPLTIVDLFLERGLILNNRQYSCLIFQGLKDFSLFKSKHVLKYSHKDNIHLLTHIIYEKPYLSVYLAQHLKDKTDLFNVKAEYILSLAIQQMNKPFIELILNHAPSLDINIIKKAHKKYRASSVTTVFYYHRYGALEYLIHEYCQPIFNNIKVLNTQPQFESREKELIDYIEYLKTLGLMLNKNDRQLLIACGNHKTTDLFDYLSKEITLKKINKKEFCIIAESIDVNHLTIAKKLIENKQLPIKKSFYLPNHHDTKLTDFSFLLVSSYSANTEALYELIKNDYHDQLKKEVNNMLFTIAQLENDIPAFILDIMKTNYLDFVKNPKILLKRLNKRKNTSGANLHYGLVKDEIEKLIVLREQKKLNKKFIHETIKQPQKVKKI